MFIVVVSVDKQTGNLIGAPQIVTQGFLTSPDDPLIAAAAARVVDAIDNPGDHTSEIALLKSQIKDGLSRFLYERTKRRPMVFPVVVEV
jgi:ribonuclease J